MLCEYGCGQEALYQFKNSKWCCSKTSSQCIYIKQKQKDSCVGKKASLETRKKMSESKKGKSPWNKGTIGLQTSTYKGITGRYSEETLKKMSISSKLNEEQKKKLKIINRRTIEEWSMKYPFFSTEEEMRYNPDKPGELEIQVRCKNHNCKNSKEQNGWFTTTYSKFYARVCAIEKNDGNGSHYFYCCDSCKNECPLFNVRSDPYKNNELPYTSSEYQIFRQEVLNRANNLCEYCEKSASHVHHSRPQKLEPGFTLDPDFGIACCENCHYKYGHEKGTECSTGSLANKVCI